MRIVIPSYKRHTEINNKSIRVIIEAGYLYSDIDVFVANEEEYQKYKSVLHPEITIIIGKKGLKEIREFIFNYYKEGQKLLCLDDDIEMIKMKHPDDSIKSCFDNSFLNLKNEIKKGFDECEISGKHLWGLYPVDNHYFMKNKISYDYKFIIGNFFGVILHKEANLLSVGQIDDYERSIRHYLLDGGVVRLNYLCAKTKFLKNKGGANAEEFERDRRMKEDQQLLCKKYKNLVYLKTKKDGLNPVLRDTRDIIHPLIFYK